MHKKHQKKGTSNFVKTINKDSTTKTFKEATEKVAKLLDIVIFTNKQDLDRHQKQRQQTKGIATKGF